MSLEYLRVQGDDVDDTRKVDAHRKQRWRRVRCVRGAEHDALPWLQGGGRRRVLLRAQVPGGRLARQPQAQVRRAAANAMAAVLATASERRGSGCRQTARGDPVRRLPQPRQHVLRQLRAAVRAARAARVARAAKRW